MSDSSQHPMAEYNRRLAAVAWWSSEQERLEQKIQAAKVSVSLLQGLVETLEAGRLEASMEWGKAKVLLDETKIPIVLRKQP